MPSVSSFLPRSNIEGNLGTLAIGVDEAEKLRDDRTESKMEHYRRNQIWKKTMSQIEGLLLVFDNEICNRQY